MPRSRPVVFGAAVGLGLVLAACDPSPPSPYPPQTPTPTPLSVAPQTMLLRPDQMRAYSRTDDSTVDAGTLADQESNQALIPVFHQQGLQVGARATFSEPTQGTPTPFVTVISQVLLFNDASGATAFVADETRRREVPPQGGTLTEVTTLPLGGADTIVGMSADTPPQSAGQPPSRALFCIIRRGRAVAELLGGGPADTATLTNFTPLVSLQEQQLTSKVQ